MTGDQNLGDVGASTEEFDINSQVLLWIAWSKIAITHEAAASRARERIVELYRTGENLGDELNKEFQSSLVTVTASRMH